jgi:hypothetical protein
LAQQTTPSEPLVIVVNRSNPVDKLSSLELRSIFLGSRSHWADGRRITLVMRDPGELERKTVLRDIYDMNESQFKTHFLHGLFTGEILVSPKSSRRLSVSASSFSTFRELSATCGSAMWMPP